MHDVLLVGAGFFGAVVAERLAADAGIRVKVIDKRPHVGGNCYSKVDAGTGVECHEYGSHIFHTANEKTWSYINGFTRFNSYHHVVHTQYKNRVYTMPLNLGTINAFYNVRLTPCEVDAFLLKEIQKEGITNPKNLEEKAVSQIGRQLYEAFIKGYTLKQWEIDPQELDAEIINRLPVRNTYNTRYFDDPYEGIPRDGYTAIFERLLDHPLIEVALATDFFDVREQWPAPALTVYTGPIDRYFAYRFGRLDWRTIVFERHQHDLPDYQGCAVMNYADLEVPFTRIHEFKHFHPERSKLARTTTFTEYSRLAGPDSDPYYPVNTPRNVKLLEQYQALARQEAGVLFGGRLGSYRYLDMDDTIAAALDCYEKEIRPRLARPV